MKEGKIQELIQEGKRIQEIIGDDPQLTQIVCTLIMNHTQNTTCSHLSMIKAALEKGRMGGMKNVG